jgi:peptide-methionine (R)-S-oxide reductase
MDAKISKTEAEWKQELGPERYRVLRQAGTEPAFSGELLHNKETGVYRCGGCGAELFASDTKFDSGSGWPSFFAPMAGDRVELIDDYGHGMHRVEVRCAHCKSHLGHVFDDGPKPTGQRFCMNSLALDFDGGKPAS